jgi:heavy metal efflux system protein
MFSFMGMRALGITANMMSLGAIDFGMIVDGSIVMVEDILRKLSYRHTGEHGETSNGEQATEAIIQQSVREMAKPILFGVLIITVVYMPILSLEGMEAKLFSPMVFTITFALLGSLLMALLLVPVLCSMFLRGNVKETKNILIERIRTPYRALLNRALQHRQMTLGITIGVFVLSVISLLFVGTEFVPKLDEGSFLIASKKLPSVSLSESLALNTKIEQVVLSFPEVKTMVSRDGRADLATDPMGVYETDAYVILKPRSQWRDGVTKSHLQQAIAKRLEHAIPGVSFSYSQPIEQRVNELVSGVRADIGIKLYGEDFDILAQKAEAIRKVLAHVPGVTDLMIERLSGNRQLSILPDRVAMARYGVSINDMRRVIETAIIGNPVTEVLDGNRRFTLRVRFPQGSQLAPHQVQNLLIETATRQRVPLNLVAKAQIEDGLEVVNREAGQRRIVIQMNVQGRDVGSFVKESQQRIAKAIQLPSGYTLEWGGQFENQQRAMAKLSLVVPMSILIIFFLLMATFGNIRHALLVLLNVPFALIGGIIALWLRGMYLSVPALVGFIALFGVAILNGLVLIATINDYET